MLECVTVCKGYSDYLDVTMKRNARQFDKWVIVTSKDDKATLRLHHGFTHIQPIISDRFEQDGPFNKAAAINDGIINLKREGWILLLDADVLLPTNFRIKFDQMDLDPEAIYGCQRYDWPMEKYLDANKAYCKLVDNRKDIGVGAFQLFHSSAKALGKLDWYPETSGTCKTDDRLFVRKWPLEKRDQAGGTAIAKKLEGIDIFHLGVLGENHEGREGGWGEDLDDKTVEQIRSIPTPEYTPTSRGVLYLINESNGFNFRLAVSIASLRRFYKGPITILVSMDLVEHKDMQAIADKFSCGIRFFTRRTGKGRKNSLLLKTQLNELSPYGTTLYLDADTLVVKDPSPMFAMAEKSGFVATRFAEWGVSGKKLRKRISSWIKEGLCDEPPKDYPAINTGVLCFTKTHGIWEEWHRLARVGMETISDFYGDEIIFNLLAPKYNIEVLPSRYNASCIYHPDKTWGDAIIIHYHGKKHVRELWFREGETQNTTSKIWCDLADTILSDNEWMLDLCCDKHTRWWLGQRTQAGEPVPEQRPAPSPERWPFPKSKLAPTDEELDWLGEKVHSQLVGSLLEFGCGVTTWAMEQMLLQDSADPILCVEDISGDNEFIAANVANVREHTQAEFQGHWDFGEREFDFVFLDSSAGAAKPGLQRHVALASCELNLQPGAHIVVHDWFKRSGTRVKAYVEADPRYEVLETFKGRTGMALLKFTPKEVSLTDSDLGAAVTDYSDYTITMVATSEHYAQKAAATIASFRKMKKWNGPIIVFTPNCGPFKCFDKDVVQKELYINGATDRQRALAAFIFGARHVETPWCLKLDAAEYAVDADPFIFEGMSEYDLISIGWGYTKPGQMVPMVDYWIEGLLRAGKIIPGLEANTLLYVSAGLKKVEPKEVPEGVKIHKTRNGKDGVVSHVWIDALDFLQGRPIAKGDKLSSVEVLAIRNLVKDSPGIVGVINRRWTLLDFKGIDDSYTLHGPDDTPGKMKHKARRIISQVRLAKTSLLREVADLCPDNRLPVNSEDTLMWRYCERLNRPWLRFPFRNHGIAHSKKILKVVDDHPEWF